MVKHSSKSEDEAWRVSIGMISILMDTDNLLFGEARKMVESVYLGLVGIVKMHRYRGYGFARMLEKYKRTGLVELVRNRYCDGLRSI